MRFLYRLRQISTITMENNPSTDKAIPFRVNVPQYPGYVFDWIDHRWVLSYTPLKGVYSPPVLHPLIQHMSVAVPDDISPYIGLVIGRDGVHFKNITRDTKSTYIFYRPDVGIEVWTYKTAGVYDTLQKHFESIRRLIARQEEYLVHVPIPQHLHDHVGRVIGKNGHHLKRLSVETKCRSIIYRSETMSLEITGTDPQSVVSAINQHLGKITASVFSDRRSGEDTNTTGERDLCSMRVM